jgi:hypothetical protein
VNQLSNPALKKHALPVVEVLDECRQNMLSVDIRGEGREKIPPLAFKTARALKVSYTKATATCTHADHNTGARTSRRPHRVRRAHCRPNAQNRAIMRQLTQTDFNVRYDYVVYLRATFHCNMFCYSSAFYIWHGVYGSHGLIASINLCFLGYYHQQCWIPPLRCDVRTRGHARLGTHYRTYYYCLL